MFFSFQHGIRVPVLLDALWNCRRADYWCQFELSIGCARECTATGCVRAKSAFHQWGQTAHDIWETSDVSSQRPVLGIVPPISLHASQLLDYASLGEQEVPDGVAASPFLSSVLMRPSSHDDEKRWSKRKDCHPWFQPRPPPRILHEERVQPTDGPVLKAIEVMVDVRNPVIAPSVESETPPLSKKPRVVPLSAAPTPGPSGSQGASGFQR